MEEERGNELNLRVETRGPGDPKDIDFSILVIHF